MKRNLINMLNEINHKVIRVTKTEFELDNGDVYTHEFELEEDITIDKFQRLLNNSKELLMELLNKIDEE